jgi:Domain of unknown function (DUF4397)
MLGSWKPAGILGLLCAALLLNGCGSSGHTSIRLANALPAQSGLTLLIDGNNDANSVAYATASGYVSVSSGSRHVQVEPTGSANDILIDQNVSVGSGSNTTILAVNSVANSGSASSLVLSDQDSTPANSNIAIRAVNASPTLAAGADIYIVSSTTNIAAVNPTAANVAYPYATSYQTVGPGSYVVVFTQPGSKVPVIETTTLTFVAGQVRTVIGLDGQNGGTTTAVLADLN